MDYYNELNEMKLVKTKRAFSSKWLGKSNEYFNVHQNLNREISTDAKVNLLKRIVIAKSALEQENRNDERVYRLALIEDLLRKQILRAF